MNCLSVNCRCCGQLEAVQKLRHLVETFKPAMVSLMETRMSEARALGLQQVLGFPNGSLVGSEGQSGGLALFWRRDVTIAIQSNSRSHIDVILSCDVVAVRQWRFTGFYGAPRREQRKNRWYLLKWLRA